MGVLRKYFRKPQIKGLFYYFCTKNEFKRENLDISFKINEGWRYCICQKSQGRSVKFTPKIIKVGKKSKYSYLYYKTQLILNLKSISRYLRLKFIWVNPTSEISPEIIFSLLKLSLSSSQMCETHIDFDPMDKNPLKLDILFTHWIIFLVGLTQKKQQLKHIFFFLIF